jgi:hypothetical protein
MSAPKPRILYCHCLYAQVVPRDVKETVLRHLCTRGVDFDAVPDLCEMAARKDPALERLSQGPVKIAACFPRAVKGLFHQAGADLDAAKVEVLNMRTESAEEVAARLDAPEIEPNLPTAKTTLNHPASDAVRPAL